MTHPNILITGPPGCGKTTLILEVVRELAIPASGFYTEEVRESGRRVGFELRTMDGETGRLAHVEIEGPYRVGRYGVTLEALETIGIRSLGSPDRLGLIVVDEIGRMECFSRAFCQAVKRALDSPCRLFGTIAERGTGFIAQVKERRDIQLFRMDPSHRDFLKKRLLGLLGQTGGVIPEPARDG
jgi:nucleoside-triphosphatase